VGRIASGMSRGWDRVSGEGLNLTSVFWDVNLCVASVNKLKFVVSEVKVWDLDCNSESEINLCSPKFKL
jgi:hypothetical protein